MKAPLQTLDRIQRHARGLGLELCEALPKRLGLEAAHDLALPQEQLLRVVTRDEGLARHYRLAPALEAFGNAVAHAVEPQQRAAGVTRAERGAHFRQQIQRAGHFFGDGWAQGFEPGAELGARLDLEHARSITPEAYAVNSILTASF